MNQKLWIISLILLTACNSESSSDVDVIVEAEYSSETIVEETIIVESSSENIEDSNFETYLPLELDDLYFSGETRLTGDTVSVEGYYFSHTLQDEPTQVNLHIFEEESCEWKSMASFFYFSEKSTDDFLDGISQYDKVKATGIVRDTYFEQVSLEGLSIEKVD